MATFTTPGVYVQELPSGVHPIVGVATSETAFVDYFARGPMGMPTHVSSFTEFQRVFGGLDAQSEASYGILQYFTQSGTSAWVVRVAAGSPAKATAQLAASGTDVLELSASSEGNWGKNVQWAVDDDHADSTSFNLTVREVATTGTTKRVVSVETYRNISLSSASAQYAPTVINQASSLVTVSVPSGASGRPDASTGGSGSDPGIAYNPDDGPFKALAGSPSDGSPPDAAALNAGIDALDEMAPFIFNLLCIPRAASLTSGYDTVLAHANTYCIGKRAFLIVDVPKGDTAAQVISLLGSTIPNSANAAVYYPRLSISDPLNSGQPLDIANSGAVAGVMARIDASRGIFKSPAGTEASVPGVTLQKTINDADNGNFNMLGINVLRSFPIYGNVVWGARTTQGSDAQASEWKYVAVRRTALYIEESLVEGLKWAVFEPNADPLWAQLRLNVNSFLNGMFRQGAFAGTTPSQAYFVKCDKDTTTQADVNRGVVNVLVGFAPLKPAEFVVIQIQQMAGQAQS